MTELEGFVEWYAVAKEDNLSFYEQSRAAFLAGAQWHRGQYNKPATPRIVIVESTDLRRLQDQINAWSKREFYIMSNGPFQLIDQFGFRNLVCAMQWTGNEFDAVRVDKWIADHAEEARKSLADRRPPSSWNDPNLQVQVTETERRSYPDTGDKQGAPTARFVRTNGEEYKAMVSDPANYGVDKP